MKNRWIKSFWWAIQGWAHLIKSEKHAKFHVLASLLVIGLGLICKVTQTEWIILIICIASVWSAEAINTALERIADRITLEKDPLIKNAKDLGAAAVFIVSIASAIIATLIFIKYLI